MAQNTGKPSDKAFSNDRHENVPGRLSVDDKGNVGWQWADDEDLLADDTLGVVARIKALVDPSLAIADEENPLGSAIQSNPKGLTKGYNPYESGTLGKQEWKKKKNLRELSKWIEMRKKLGQDTTGE
jgi:hypothetical protein